MMDLMSVCGAAGLAVIGLYAPAVGVQDDGVRLIGVAQVAPTVRDGSGLDGSCGPVTQDTFGGWGSAIEWTGRGNRYLVLPDRGPKDGAEEYKCRVVEVELTVHDRAQRRATLTPVGATLLRNGKYSLVGLSSVYDAADPAESLRFDPEGLRLLPGGDMLIADEYGPVLAVFSPDGLRRHSVAVPRSFTVDRPHARAINEDRLNRVGRAANAGFEGLALTDGGTVAWALMQGPLLQDQGREGVNVRLLRVDLRTGNSAQYVYPMQSVHHGCNEILAVDDRRFLVIERDGRSGNKAVFKHVVMIDVSGATDVSSVAALPHRGLPESVRPVAVRTVIDLLDERWGLAGGSFPEKIEGLAFGPDGDDGSRTLVVTSDNDFKEDQPSWAWVFSVPRHALDMNADRGAGAR